ncbi:uncharacterized protein JCM6883_004543 [Sporobolomyces salmoneus]|uniref:uncharacterized protein n=1 Tax=Sporobolomyces salmoneus TaxID=183962 RepID=UPI00316BAA8B
MLAYSSRIDPLPSSYPSLLSSLPLQSPHLPPTSIYHSLLSSNNWIQNKFTKLETLGDDTSNDHSGHRVVEGAYGHTGCVNAMDWEEGSRERLATAGDDTKICIWKPGYLPRKSQLKSPVAGYGLSETITTDHTANIFAVRWAPQNEHRLFSAAGDSKVRVFDLSSSTNPSLSTTPISSPSSPSHFPWSHHTSACTQVIHCHGDRVKRISTEPYSPSLFLTCSEDGSVRQHDLRSTHRCQRSFLRAYRGSGESGDGCPQPLANYGREMRLYSLSLSKLQPHLFTVAGTSPFAYLHDRRMLRTPMIRDWSITPHASNITECARESIVAVKMNPYDSSDLIVSYSEKGIYRFDIYGDEYEPVEEEEPTKEEDEEEEIESGETSGERNGSEVKKRSGEEGEEGRVEKKKPKVEGEAKDDQSDSEGTTTQEVESDENAIGVELRVPAHEEEEEEEVRRESSTVETNVGDESHSEEEEEPGPASDDDPVEAEDGDGFDWSSPPPTEDPFADIQSHVPIVAPKTHYTGHANSQTVKDVNFALEGNVVVTGSDDGNLFVFEKETSKCIGIWAGDDSVVNVLQPHPRLPLLAVSGIDSSIKIFGPSPSSQPVNTTNLVSEYETIKRRNAEGRLPPSSRFATGLPEQLLRLIAMRMNEVNQVGEDGTPGRGLRVQFEGDDDEDGEEREVCVVM